MKMKFLIILIATMFCLSSCARGQNNNSDKQIIEMLDNFYTEHNAFWSIEPPTDFVVLREKLDSLNSIYCTSTFRYEAKKSLEGEYGQDLLTKDNPGSYSFENLKIEKDSTLENTYIVYYTTSNFDESGKLVKSNIVFNVSVVKEGDGYKINSVQ
jgi:hypothetical protein